MKLEQLKRSINGEPSCVAMFELLCALSLHIDNFTEEERQKAQSRYKECLTILPSKKGGYYLYLKSFNDKKPIEERVDFWQAVQKENNFRKEHNQDLINYNIDKIRFFMEH